MNGVVLLSGGLDSATVLKLATLECDEVLALSFIYGQVHSSKELDCALKLSLVAGLEHEVIVLPDIYRGSKSALLEGSGVPIPEEEYHDPEKESPSSTVVPFRNGTFISLAVALAGARGISDVYIANHATDARGFAYPDCTPEFVGAMAAAVYVGSGRTVRLHNPFQWMSKADVVLWGLTHYVPYELTWSCYRGGEKACGRCPTCIERLAAFAAVGRKDPIEYESTH